MISLLCAALVAVSAPPDSGWYFTDRVYQDVAKRQLASESLSQSFLSEIAVCVGFSDPGRMEKVVEISAPPSAARLLFAIATHPKAAKIDTLRPKPLTNCPSFKPDLLERQYFAVVRLGGEVPDSLRVVLADESSFTIRYRRSLQ